LKSFEIKDIELTVFLTQLLQQSSLYINLI